MIKKQFVLLCCLILVFISFVPLATAKSKTEPGTIAADHIFNLATQIGDRVAGTEDEKRAAQYIVEVLRKLGLNPEIQTFTTTNRAGETIVSQNIIAKKIEESDRQIIVGAHYDTVKGVQGVDDNGSGVGVILEAIESFQHKKMPYTLTFVFFGAEEIGTKGSEYYTSQMTPKEIQNTVAMVNLDSLIAGDKMYVYGGEGEDGWVRDQALDLAKKKKLNVEPNPGLNPEYPKGSTGDWSDHAAFKKLGIPFAYFEATNWALGDQDGYVQTEKHGAIWHNPEKDSLNFIRSQFPGRMEERLHTFSILLIELLTHIKEPKK
ncbi:M20/M25/M40 family metallo-hydrolase [Aneurinibacillus thermoaerophilus]|uniref:M20/M25/M40 family metallo-hydrolase n=1 Tax=Aneurinibacillus thermoaerophilus TaxID=143495 RepID=UPI002E1AA75E|nr:M20/M25/M40 family metallo-hydrolase [Aneurinibacillus thermoaerophilus]MED0675294.1 M20/M25/M40 family metallo-hydrolase [Aneurinibacillus thermoaerophilus]